MTTTTNGPWNVGYCSGTNIVGTLFQPFRVMNGKYLKPGCYGTSFPTLEAASAYSLAHGFSATYHKRPWGFIGLRLSPATRRYVAVRLPFKFYLSGE